MAETRMRGVPPMRGMTLFNSAVLLGALVSRLANGLALGEPPDGKAYLAAWTDGSAPYYDSPSAFNRRIGQNTYAFQLAQTIPLTPYNSTTGAGGPMDAGLVGRTDTAAAIYLTVYPQAIGRVSELDLRLLARQLAAYQAAAPPRQVFLRFAPEMQGRWMPYGLQPAGFLALWRRMFDIIKATAPHTIIVWAPNGAMGYPYGIRLSDVSSKADQDLLDTNKNGQLDSNDDAYLPYYPGDAYVDWNGISWYWKGNEYPYRVNQLVPSGYTAGAMTGKTPAGAIGAGGPQTFTSFYDTYCQNKPCMFSEMGAAFHTNSTTATSPAVSQQSLQQAWWRDSLTSSTFMNAFPRIKMFMLFEHEKPEDGGDMRDYRIATDAQVRSAFLDDFQAVQSRFIWADNATVAPNAAGKGAKGSSTRLDRSLGWLLSVAIGSTVLVLDW
ncbi:hypothetical protein PtB15_9B125 [Puccinia triticina]|nr:hypothetical protein PtB15_9B125 [Puccinia triticina]